MTELEIKHICSECEIIFYNVLPDDKICIECGEPIKKWENQ